VSAKYSIIFVLLAAAFVTVAVVIKEVIGFVAILFLYAAFSFFLLASAYGGLGPALFLKKADGRQSPFSWILFAPYLLLNYFVLWLYRRNNREPPFAEASPNLFFVADEIEERNDGQGEDNKVAKQANGVLVPDRR
jgi:hypothetical protein